MADKRGKCMVAVYADVPGAIEDEYNRWYDTHHIPERLKVPGFLGAVRYQAYFGEPKYLTVYELAHAGVFKDPLLVKLSNEPSEWDRRMAPQVQVVSTTIYNRIFELKEPPAEHASRAITVRFDPPAEMEPEFNDWYNSHHLPSLLAVPGMYCGRRYQKRWGDGSNYLAFYEYDDESIQTTDAWKSASYTDWTQKILPKLGTPKLARHRRIFAAYAA
jgi:hypothetical protein